MVDFSECSFADVYSDGEVKILYSETSMVPNQHKSGGQSAQRFERNREILIDQWFKEINRVLMTYNREIYVGVSDIYYKRFFNMLHTYNKKKIKQHINCSYSNKAGVYDMINLIKKEKSNTY